MTRLDSWVASRGNGRWVNPEAQDDGTPIQQVRAEIVEVVEALKKLTPRDRCLEIGLGEFGGTHTLWRMLFGWVRCIEMNRDFVHAFIRREGLSDNEQQTAFIMANSLAGSTVNAVRSFGPFDFLHIDGNHDYEAVRSDWENYSPMVRPGGLVALHDLLTPGVSRVVEELEREERAVRRIVHSKHVGTALVQL